MQLEPDPQRVAQVCPPVSRRRPPPEARALNFSRERRDFEGDIAVQHQMRQSGAGCATAEAPMPAVATNNSLQAAARKDLYEIGEVPPLGHVPARMHAWSIRKERHGPPETSMQLEVLPT